MEGKASDNRAPTPEISSMKPTSPTLDPAHQHHDAHHSNRQSIDEKGVGDGALYTKEIPFDTSNGQSDDGDSREKPADEKTAAAASGDEEAGAPSGGKPKIWRRYRKQIRIAVHAVIWLLFTG